LAHVLIEGPTSDYLKAGYFTGSAEAAPATSGLPSKDNAEQSPIRITIHGQEEAFALGEYHKTVL
jgi:hypothetical protein